MKSTRALACVESSNRVEMVSLKEFSAHAAHEISNPLNAISINAELATQLILAGRATESLELLKRLARDCWQCGQEVRTFARLGAALDGPVQTLALEPLLVQVWETVAQHARRPLPQFICEIDSEVQALPAESLSLSYGLSFLVKLLLTEGTVRVRMHASLETPDRVLLLVTGECADESAPARQRAPLGLAFIEQLLRHQGAALHWRLDLGSAFEVRFAL